MNSDSQAIVHKKERLLFILSFVVSILTIILLFVTIIGIPILLFIASLTIISHAISIAYIRLNGVELSNKQFSDIYDKITHLSQEMKINKPEAYIVESGGILNAFASRIFGLFGKNILVLYSDIVELIENGQDEELEFIIAHELSHIKRNHIVKRIVIFPAMWIPFIGEAYSRACEFTADQMAVLYTKKPEKALRALTVLASGKHLSKYINIEEYLHQYNHKKGFFISLTELLSTHPALPRRIMEIEAYVGNVTVPLEKKSKGNLILIFLSSILAIGIFIWSINFVVDATMEYIFGDIFVPGESTELMAATINGDTDEMKRLLDEGADPNEQEEEMGSTALGMAADYDQLEAAKLLLEYGADPNLADNYGYNPLMGAVFMENKDMISLLLKAGADPYLENEEGMSAISQAEEFGYPELAKLMKEYK